MFDPHIYACQSISSSISGSNSNPTIQNISNESQKPPVSPLSSPQKNKHVNSNTVIPLQTPVIVDSMTPQRTPTQVDDSSIVQFETETPTLNNSSSANSSNSGDNSRKTSTETFLTANDIGHENNSFLTPKSNVSEDVSISTTPISSLDPNAVKQSPQRRHSRFLVSPTVIETANNEFVVQETPQPPLQSPQQPENSLEMNINEDSYQRSDAPETDLQPQPSASFRMPETLEQLKIELENITHAHVSTKSKEPLSTQPSMSQCLPLENDDSHEPISEAHVESSTADVPSIHDAVGSLATGDNTSVYNSRRTSADMNTNPTDLTSTASGFLDNDDNLVSEPIQDEVSKLSFNLVQGDK